MRRAPIIWCVVPLSCLPHGRALPEESPAQAGIPRECTMYLPRVLSMPGFRSSCAPGARGGA